MKKTQKNKMAMNLSTREACERQMAIINEIPAFGEAFQAFIQKLDRVLELFLIQDMKTTGITQKKLDRKESMAKTAFGIASSIRFFATNMDDKELHNKIHYTVWELAHVRDFISLQRCVAIRALTEKHMESLVRYGVTAADLADLRIKIAAFEETIAMPRDIRAIKKAATMELTVLFQEIDHILKLKMDLMVKRLKESHPQFYNEYFAARMIINSGHRRSQKADSPETPTNT